MRSITHLSKRSVITYNTQALEIFLLMPIAIYFYTTSAHISKTINIITLTGLRHKIERGFIVHVINSDVWHNRINWNSSTSPSPIYIYDFKGIYSEVHKFFLQPGKANTKWSVALGFCSERQKPAFFAELNALATYMLWLFSSQNKTYWWGQPPRLMRWTPCPLSRR